MGADPRGRRHDSPTWLRAGQEAGDSLRGRKLVVQMVQTRQPNGAELRRAAGCLRSRSLRGLRAAAGDDYGDDVTHVITEQGVANLLRPKICWVPNCMLLRPLRGRSRPV
jgi:malonate decarboxylase alpha subunit